MATCRVVRVPRPAPPKDDSTHPPLNLVKDSPILHPAVRKVCTYVSEHIAADLRLKHLARFASLNANHFSELFHRETGLTLRIYIECSRIERAKDLLVSGRISVTEIAAIVGYNDLGTFARAFKRQTLTCPRTFRSLSRRGARDPSDGTTHGDHGAEETPESSEGTPRHSRH
jgi:transcriptional regulator GlxA family with amidase domain